MKTVFAIILSLGLFGTAGFAQPTVTQVSNAASFSLSPLPNSGIAQGGFFSIFGSGFGGASATCGTNFADCEWSSYPLPQTVAQTSVSVTVGTTTVMPYINFAVNFGTYSQINAVLPSNTPIGAGTITVTYNGTASATFPVTVVASTFGAFSINQAGSGPGVIFDGSNVVGPFHTAKPGDVVVVWGSGLGPAPDISTEQSAPPTQTNLCGPGSSCPVTVWVGGQQAAIQYAGRSGYTAIDQIDFVVPSGVSGCYVSVAVQTQSGGPTGPQTTSNFTTMAVDANGATCQDADGVNMNQIASAVQSKQSANVAAIGLLSNFWNVNLGGGTFIQWDNDTVDGQIGTFDTAALELFRGFTRLPSVGSCTAIPYRGYPPPVDYGLGYVTYLDAGPALNIQGPLGNKSVAKNSNGNGYDGLVGGDTTTGILDATATAEAPFYWNATANGDGTYNATGIASGNYTVTGPGGAGVNAITGTIDVSSAAAAFVWTNAGTFNNQTATPVIPRNTPLNITWTSADTQGFVDIALVGSTLQNTLPSVSNPEPGVAVECVVKASAGSFNVPTYVLAALPAGAPDVPLAGLVLVGPASAVTPINPLPTGLDAAYLYYRIISGYTVQWQ
jgi:uncharacterized protein (TIGR03437 family)